MAPGNLVAQLSTGVPSTLWEMLMSQLRFLLITNGVWGCWMQKTSNNPGRTNLLKLTPLMFMANRVRFLSAMGRLLIGLNIEKQAEITKPG